MCVEKIGFLIKMLLAILTGFFWKIYDDVVDDECPYSINITLISCLMMAYSCILMATDIPFLLLMLAVVGCNGLHLLQSLCFTYAYANAIDTKVWKVGLIPILGFTCFHYNQILNYLTPPHQQLWFLLTLIFYFEMGSQYQGNIKFIIRTCFVIVCITLGTVDSLHTSLFAFIVSYFIVSIGHFVIRTFSKGQSINPVSKPELRP